MVPFLKQFACQNPNCLIICNTLSPRVSENGQSSATESESVHFRTLTGRAISDNQRLAILALDLCISFRTDKTEQPPCKYRTKKRKNPRYKTEKSPKAREKAEKTEKRPKSPRKRASRKTRKSKQAGRPEKAGKPETRENRQAGNPGKRANRKTRKSKQTGKPGKTGSRKPEP